MAGFIRSPPTVEICRLPVCSGPITPALLSDTRSCPHPWHLDLSFCRHCSVVQIERSRHAAPLRRFDTRNARSVGFAQFTLEENRSGFCFSAAPLGECLLYPRC